MSWRERLGDRVMVGLPEPGAFIRALASRPELRDVTLLSPVAAAGSLAAMEHPGIRVITTFATVFTRDAVEQGRIEFIPVTLHAAAALVERFAANVTVVVVAEPEPNGTVRPGAALAFDDAAVRETRRLGGIVLAQVVESQPQIPGVSFHTDDFDGFVTMDDVPVPAVERDVSFHAAAVARHLTQFIPDGATIQAGIGGVPDEAMALLTDKRDLGIHTEVFGPGLGSLIEAGVATGACKTLHPGMAVLTICAATAVAYAHRNPALRLLPAREVLDPREIAKNRVLRCVNSALEVDLAGQVNAEMRDGRQYSGVGGQLDFFRACRLADDSLSILVLESSAAGGRVSRIVPAIREGHVVTSSRYDVDIVITEHGIAWLRDRTTRERARDLIEIAHPEHRGVLTEAAGNSRLLSASLK